MMTVCAWTSAARNDSDPTSVASTSAAMLLPRRILQPQHTLDVVCWLHDAMINR